MNMMTSEPFNIPLRIMAEEHGSRFTREQSRHEPEVERREVHRFRTAFRPACIIAKRGVQLGTMRNMSRQGVMIELDRPLRLGERVRYFWSEGQIVDGTIAWIEGKSHGIKNVHEERVFDPRYASRSVRVPCEADVELWVGGEAMRGQMCNISLGGMRVKGVNLRRGTPLTVRVCGIELPNTSVRWTDVPHAASGEVGLVFARPLSRCQLAEMLCHESVRFDAFFGGEIKASHAA